ncbi:hypothetical protein H70357_11845 [Paenibacillus sp. FSL H7-0357]|uniref:hypothetical protein n=1 Tax=Paenibacillus sp. FSL H7-0357 TaxID=1536774 RepID=UPI0004F5E312|nr:hypothetical protein [Paenibacillus sp. FSL H7-0357]AIQ17271.1 hypothetical protein H70357_11845 [Paenibacillus sp. FSL H7-0357]
MEKYSEMDISTMIERLDELQNSQRITEAIDLQKELIERREDIIPFLKLSKKDSSFLTFFSAFFIPECDKDFLKLMKKELFEVINSMDLTEHVDLLLVESLTHKGVFTEELNKKLFEKQTHIQYFYNYSNMNKYILSDYLNKLSSLLKT